MRARFVKVFRDLRLDAGRNAMLVLAIAIGVLSVGTILGAYAVLTREMARNYLGTRPADATIVVDGNLSPSLVAEVRSLHGIAEAERHATLLGRMKIGDDWYPMLFFVVDDFGNIRTNRFTHLSGAWPPPTGTILIERTARVTTKADEGDFVTVRTPSGPPRSIRVSGIVHDPGLAPAWQEQEGYAYLTLETLHALGERRGFDELRIRLDDPDASADEIEAAATRVARYVETKGQSVHEIQIPTPRTHPHQNQMRTILVLFLVFAFATLILSAVLVATSLATLMTRQLREIGVMKAIGADSKQIASMYLLSQGIIATAATIIGVPLSEHTAALMIGRIGGLLNLQIVDGTIPHWVALIQSVSGILIPLIVAAVPVWRGSIISVREALVSHGVSSTDAGTGIATTLRFLGTSSALAVRNVFRQRGRLLMSLALLAAGGGLFMTGLNVSKAWEANLEKMARFRHYDLEIQLRESLPAKSSESAIRRVSGVVGAEAWSFYRASYPRGQRFDVAHVYPDKGHGSFFVIGVPDGTKLVSFPVLEGRWLRSGRAREIVLNHTARENGMKIGDELHLNVDGRPTTWTLVGFVEDIGSIGATAYVPASALAAAAGEDPAATNMIRVAFDDRSVASVLRRTRDVEAALGPDAHIRISLPMALIRTAIGEHMRVLVSSLLALALLMAIVGGFGLASTMSMNVLERTRELGVMRAIGAGPRTTAAIVVAEGYVIAGLSFVLAVALTTGLSAMLGRIIGAMAFRTPLPLVFSGAGIGLWLLVLVVGSAIATAMPARRASRMTVREALAYA